jgi:hypothetical protein
MSLRRTVVEVEVLWDDEITAKISDLTLEQIAYEITEGHASGMVTFTSDKVLTKKQMAEALKRQGSDPEFLGDN